MEIFHESNPGLLKKSAIALGFFDGVHLGHQAVIATAINEAKSRHLTSAVVTFKDHPRALTQGSSPLLLTVIEQRLAIFEQMGVEAALVLTFTEDLCRLSPKEYVKNVLVDCMGSKVISVGYNHHFGRQREGDARLLAHYGTEYGFDVQVTQPVFVDGQEVSSSKIRQCLESSDIMTANKLLSRPYSLFGKVITGDKRGNKLGFPTANLQISQFQLLPAKGVYAAKVKLLSHTQLKYAVVNIGNRPTFASDNLSRAIPEVHILDFEGDLYDQNMEVYLYGYIRPEVKFDSIDALKKQINLDCKNASQILTGQV